MLTQFFDWFFRDRRTGRVVVAQWPNVPLWAFIAASVIELVFGPAGRVGLALHVIALVSLAIWAGDEVWRGVNPWRRCLGAAVLIGGAVRLLAAG